jgi:hypothetical protein
MQQHHKTLAEGEQHVVYLLLTFGERWNFYRPT